MFIKPDWPAPTNMYAYTTTRIGGFTNQPYDSFNLAQHVGDDVEAVTKNRQLLNEKLQLPKEPLWLNQTHSNIVIDTNHQSRDADGCYTNEPKQICVVMTADCLPILICNKQGTEVAAVHGGWRSLAKGIIEQAIQKFKSDPKDLMVWLGPAIGPDHYEVGNEVREIFLKLNEKTTSAFEHSCRDKSRLIPTNTWLLDIYQITTILLNSLNITQIYGGNFCTYSDPKRFYSYRRDNQTGRMATLIWQDG